MNTFQMDDRVCDVRREAGALGWFVLEHLALHAIIDGDEVVVGTSVRDLASAVSMNKDTVARAVGLLVQLGVVTRHQPARGGRFGGGHYALTLPAGFSLLAGNVEPPLERPRRAHARTHARGHVHGQLSLLDLADDDPPAALGGCPPTTPQPSDALAPEVPDAVHESPGGTHEPSATC